MTAFQVLRFARAFIPKWVVVENVLSMRRWGRYSEFLEELGKLGYHIREQVLDAADFGVPQSRRRLFLLCDRRGLPQDVRPSGRSKRNAADIVELNGHYTFSPLLGRGRAKATLRRAQRAIKKMGAAKPFLLVYYSSDGGGGWQKLQTPLRTMTTVDRFALVKPSSNGHQMRMLQVPELRQAMGFPSTFKLRRGTRRDKIHLLGNGVCPPVMKSVVRSLTTEPPVRPPKRGATRRPPARRRS